MDPKATSSQCNPYFKLPPQVTAIKDRIGLGHFTQGTKQRAENLIKLSAPQFEKQGLKHKYYFLDDVFPPIKKKGKPPRRGDGLNAKEKKVLFNITKKSGLKYCTFEKINLLWNDYLKDVLKGAGKDTELRLAKTDYHGAKFAVLAALNPSLVGTVGIVVQETKNTFKIIDQANRVVSKSVSNPLKP